MELAYDGNFHSPELKHDQASTLSLVLTPMSRIELQANFDFWASERAPGEQSIHGRGDTHLTAQWTLLGIDSSHVVIAVAYDAKLPTANNVEIGTGWVDHRLLLPLSFFFRHLELDVTAGIDADRRISGLAWGAEGAVTVTTDLAENLTANLGWSGQSIETDQPSGAYGSGAVTWQVGLVALELGGRLGLSSGTPRFGLMAGVTAAVLTRPPPRTGRKH